MKGIEKYDNNMFMLKAASLLNLPGNWEWDILNDTIACTDASFSFKTTPIPHNQMIVRREINYHYAEKEEQKIQAAIEQLHHSPEVKVEFTLTSHTGDTKIFYAFIRLVKDPSGQPITLQCSCHDVSGMREMESQLKNLKESFDHAERMSNMGNWMYNFRNKKITCSDNLFRLVDHQPNAFEPTIENLLQLLPQEQQQEIKQKVATAINNRISSEVELKIKTKNGSSRYLVSRIKEVSSDSGRELIVGTLHDITEEKKLQSKLEERTALAEMLIENSIDMISAYDMDLNFIAWNKKCEERYNLKKEEVMGKNILDIFPHFEGKDIMEQLERVKQGTLVHYKDRKYRTSEGYYESFIIPLQHAGSQVFGILMITHDITEIKKSSIRLNELNDILKQKNEEFERSNQELASFSYVASHDLQEPLRKIQTFSHRLMEKEFDNLSTNGKDYLKRMSSAAERMQTLIEDLLTFSRTNTAPRVFEKTDLNNVVKQIIKDLKESIEEKQAVIRFENLPETNVVRFQFKQLLENLILNSLKYQRPEASPVIEINSETIKGSEVPDANAETDLNYYKIDITDNGIGFQQQYAEKIFELFQRLHGKSAYPGTGLGLAICKKIVQNHNGFITAKGEPGQGATFTIYIPVII